MPVRPRESRILRSNVAAQNRGEAHSERKRASRASPISTSTSARARKRNGRQRKLAHYTSHNQYSELYAKAAVESRLPVNDMSMHERQVFNTIGIGAHHADVRRYCDFRNRILRAWLNNPRRWVTREAAICLTTQEEHWPLVGQIWDYLHRYRYINFGVLDPPNSVPSQIFIKPEARVPRILVIGAGISGLATARELMNIFLLTQNGIPKPEITILEAKPRVGGRVCSFQLVAQRKGYKIPARVDLGAMIVTGLENGNPLKPIMTQQLNIPVHYLRNTDGLLYDSSGHLMDEVTDSEAEKIYNHMVEEACQTIFRRTKDGVSSKELNYPRDFKPSPPNSFIPVKVNHERKRLFKAAEEATDCPVPVSFGHALETVLQKIQTNSRNKTSEDLIRAINWHVANLEFANGCDVRRLSCVHWDQDDGHEFEGEHALVVGGYGRLAEALAEGLNVKFGKAVAKIETECHDVPVKVTTVDGEVFEADAVVCTVSLGVLKSGRVKWEPELPDWKKNSIQRMGFGFFNKVVLVFSKMFWPAHIDVFNTISAMPATHTPSILNDYDQTRGMFYQFWNLYSTTQLPVLCAFVSGKAAEYLESLSDLEIVEGAMAALKKMFTDKIPGPIETIVTKWSKDPFSYGTYSYIPPGATGRDMDNLASDCMDGKIFFAGEATCRQWPATVHGAYISGQRTAASIADFLLGPVAMETSTRPPQQNQVSLTNMNLNTLPQNCCPACDIVLPPQVSLLSHIKTHNMNLKEMFGTDGVPKTMEGKERAEASGHYFEDIESAVADLGTLITVDKEDNGHLESGPPDSESQGHKIIR